MSRKWWNILGFLLAIMLVLILLPLAQADVYRGGYRDIDINSHNTRTVNRDDSVKVSTGDVNVSGTTTQELNNTNQNIAQTTVTVEGDTIPADTTHYENQDIKLKNTPDNVMVTPGSGDTCIVYIGGSLSIPGLGAGLNFPLSGKECRKLVYYDRMMAIGKYAVAAKFFCDLKGSMATFDKDEKTCEAAVLYVPPPKPVSKTAAPITDILMADITQEEYEQEHEKVEERYLEQQEVNDKKDEELRKLRATVKKALEERDKRDAEKAASEQKFKAYLASKDDE